MAMKPTGALNQQVDRGQIADHHVEIQVQALLDDLRGDDDGSLRPLVALLAEAGEDILLNLVPPCRGEAGVEEDQIIVGDDTGLLQDPVYLLTPPHGVADDSRTAAIAQGVLQLLYDGRRLPCDPFQRHGATLRRLQRHHTDLAFRRPGDGWIRYVRQILIRHTGIGLQQIASRPLREGGGKNDHRGADGPQPTQQTLEKRGHISIVGVHLVEDDRLVAEAQEPDEEVARLHHAEKGLVDRADAEGGQQGALARQEPFHRGQRASIALVHSL